MLPPTEHASLRWTHDRTGSFPGMLKQRTFRIVLVRPGHGVDDESDSKVDRSVTYDGRGLKIDLRKKN
jgi:alpha-D-xyloside xylohydrolase